MSASHKERLLRGDAYQAGDPELVAERERARLLCLRFNGGDATALDELLGSVGEGCEILAPLHCDYGSNVVVGARSFMNWGTMIYDCAPVTIGDDVLLAAGVQLIAATHGLDAAERRAGWEYARPVTIEDGAWLGAGVLVLPGVTIGAEAVVGAGAVVTKDVAARTVVAGNPARVIREL